MEVDVKLRTLKKSVVKSFLNVRHLVSKEISSSVLSNWLIIFIDYFNTEIQNQIQHAYEGKFYYFILF